MIALTAELPDAPTLLIVWGTIALVIGVALAVTVVITGAFALGVRLLAVGAPDAIVPPGSEADGPDVVEPPRTRPRPVIATIGALVCFAVGAAGAVYGVMLVIPAFHP
jgi:hypothetical protein